MNSAPVRKYRYCSTILLEFVVVVVVVAVGGGLNLRLASQLLYEGTVTNGFDLLGTSRRPFVSPFAAGGSSGTARSPCCVQLQQRSPTFDSTVPIQQWGRSPPDGRLLGYWFCQTALLSPALGYSFFLSSLRVTAVEDSTPV
ncbi:hypothetical protein F5884DRAFT_857685 [Xylogone sp. PMI_703]|nr:hypothetical protein F5884DRAFT_857685 [Xylogone sp. PMI_703]